MKREDWMLADLHIHSRFSRACSKKIDFKNLVKWAKIKGLDLLGTGDFTHPVWFEEIKKLKEKDGFYFFEDFPFVISGEVSLIYTQERGRKVHLNLLVPSIEIAEKIHSYIDLKGFRRDYDGRPIFGISCEDFTRDLMSISQEIEIIPAHIWTPYFGVFGSMSGFDSLEQAFGEQTKYIHSIETGISSDPPMNWRIQELLDENVSILSFSDAHSFWPWRLGREATIFKKCDSYKSLIEQIRNNDFIGTIETDPAYGKYHWDGHRNCNFSCSPIESRKLGNICPKCGKTLIIGVENRVEKLSQKPLNFKPFNAKIFYRLLPLHEIISLNYQVGMDTKKAWSIYNSLIDSFGDEFEILLSISQEEFLKAGIDKSLIDLVLKNRLGKIKVNPGYDGEYGQAILSKQLSVF